MTVIGLIGVNRFLVTADQPVGRYGLIDVCRSECSASHDAAALIHGDVRLVAKEVFAFLLGPSGIGIDRAPYQFARRSAVGIRWRRTARRLRRIDRRAHQRGVDQRAALYHKTRALDL